MAQIRATYPGGTGLTEVSEGGGGMVGGNVGIGDFWGALLNRRLQEAERRRQMEEAVFKEDLAMKQLQRRGMTQAAHAGDLGSSGMGMDAQARMKETRARIAAADTSMGRAPTAPTFIGGQWAGYQAQPGAMTGIQRQMFMPAESRFAPGATTTPREVEEAGIRARQEEEDRMKRLFPGRF